MEISADLALNEAIPEKKENKPTPIGVFWDFENVRVPRKKSAFEIVQAIRARFFTDHFETNFTVVCDTFKESREILDDLNAAQIDIVYTRATAKNSIDEKLKQCMRRFARVNKSPSTLILLTGDVNFVTDVGDFINRDRIDVILIHDINVSQTLLQTVNQAIPFSSIIENLPLRRVIKEQQKVKVCVTGLPQELSTDTTAARLLRLSDNCGGRLVSINADEAILVFGSAEFATRYVKYLKTRIRLNDEIVGFSQIEATLISSDRPNSPRASPSNEPKTPQRNNESSTDETEPQPKHTHGKKFTKRQRRGR